MDPGDELVAGAKAARSRGDSGHAALFYINAAAVARDQGDLLAYAHRLRHAGELLLEDGKDADAAPLLADALAVYRAARETPPLDLANLLRPYAMLKEKAGERAEAIAFWTEARDLYEAAGVGAGVLECTRRLATPDQPPIS